MDTFRPGPAHASLSRVAAWCAVALTPPGWVLGIVVLMLSGESDAGGPGPVVLEATGILFFMIAPTAALVLAVRAPGSKSRSRRAAVAVSASLLVTTCALTLLAGWTGVIAIAIVTLSVVIWARPPNE